MLLLFINTHPAHAAQTRSRPQNTANKCPAASYSTVCYTPKGLAYYSDWGTLRNTGNMMFVASLMYKYGANKQANICFARNQMRYILGSDTGKSYLIGFGTNQPQRPHHRQSACSARYTEPCTPFNGGTCCAGQSGACVEVPVCGRGTWTGVQCVGHNKPSAMGVAAHGNSLLLRDGTLPQHRMLQALHTQTPPLRHHHQRLLPPPQ
jgi:hypothetical protein